MRKLTTISKIIKTLEQDDSSNTTILMLQELAFREIATIKEALKYRVIRKKLYSI